MLAEGHALLERLFGIAETRLRERGISMRSSSAVLDYLLNSTDWRGCLNPLRTLDGSWSKQVGAVIEGLLLEQRLKSGDALEIRLGETPFGSQIEFDTIPST